MAVKSDLLNILQAQQLLRRAGENPLLVLRIGEGFLDVSEEDRRLDPGEVRGKHEPLRPSQVRCDEAHAS